MWAELVRLKLVLGPEATRNSSKPKVAAQLKEFATVLIILLEFLIIHTHFPTGQNSQFFLCKDLDHHRYFPCDGDLILHILPSCCL